jgi:multidrug resistance protein, MATE family
MTSTLDPKASKVTSAVPTETSLLEEIKGTLRLALPISFGHIALMAMGLVDCALVGRISAKELAAVSMGHSISFAMTCPGMGVSLAIEPMASQAIGAGQPERAWNSYQAGLYAAIITSFPCMLLAVLGTMALPWMGVDAEIVPSAFTFVLVSLPSIPGRLVFMSSKSYLEAHGITRPVVWGGWIANIINFVFGYTLVFGDVGLKKLGMAPLGIPSLGCLGAAISMSVSYGFLSWFLWRASQIVRAGQGSKEARKTFRERWTLMKTCFRIGLPIGFQILTEVGMFSVVAVLAGRWGSETSAAHQIAISVASFTFMGVMGVSAATAIRVGRAIGAQEEKGPRRAGFVGLGTSLVYMSVCAGIFRLFPKELAQVFSPDMAVVVLAVPYIKVAATFQLADGLQSVASGALRGAADTKFAWLANVVCHWGIGFPVALLLAFWLGMGVVGLWWGLCTGLGAIAVVLCWRFVRLSSEKIQVISEGS